MEKESLEQILLDQYHLSLRLSKKMKKARKIMGEDHLLIEFQNLNEKRTQFFEQVIEDKTLLHKKQKKKKQKSIDILAKNPIHEAWRSALKITFISYRIFGNYILNLYKKDKNEKNNS